METDYPNQPDPAPKLKSSGLPDGVEQKEPGIVFLGDDHSLMPQETPLANNTLAEHPVEIDSGTSEQEIGDNADAAEWYSLDPQYIGFTRMAGLITTAVLGVLGIIGVVALWLFMSDAIWWKLGLGLYAVVISGLFTMALVWPKIEYRHYFWRLDDKGLEIKRGVLWRHRISVPTARLQHADISQGPVQRMFGLSKLTVYTAGTSNASVELDGLSHDTAAWVRDQLILRREELDVV